jgi:hypothetical protein
MTTSATAPASSRKPETATRRLVARHTIYGGRLFDGKDA